MFRAGLQDGYAKESQSPSLLQVPEIDKSDVAAARRAELLEVLLPCRRINPSVLDEQGRTFLFRAGSWDIYGSDRRQQLLRDVIDLAQEAGVSLNHQVGMKRGSRGAEQRVHA